MTEYKIVLYYEKPMPEFFQNSMEAMLKRGVEQGFISGYEFQKKELEKGKTIEPIILKDSEEIKKGYAESLKETINPPEITKALKEDEERKAHEIKREPVQDNTAGLDTRAEKGAEELHGKRKAGGPGGVDKTLRDNRTDSRKKGRRKI